jgi:zinc/manganese transport system substrate-binding protein
VRILLVAAAAVALVALSGCGGRTTATGAKLNVVAAENFWGSIAAQLGGDRATVDSVIVDPSTDPHDYEPTPSDARELAGAKVAVVNGIGYDNWATRLLAADGGAAQVVSAGDVLGLSEGDNPHQWYSPSSVRRVAAAITTAFQRADPKDAAYFAGRRRLFLTKGLARYDALRAEIRRRFAGVPVGYSETIFEPLGHDLGLRLLTPTAFATAIAEGADVSVRDKETVDNQLRRHEIAVWVFNSQNVTPEVNQLNALARAERIPLTTVTETLSPASATFQQWQVAELERLLTALHRATGR